MALNRPALVDALTEAGLEAEAVRRAVDVLEQSYADTAKQSEVHLRFDAMEKSLADHDRLNEEQSKSLGSRLRDFKGELERRIDGLKDSMDREFAAVRNEIGSVRNELTTGFAAVRSEMAGVRNELTTGFAAVRSEMAGLRNEMNAKYSELNGKITMLQWVIGVLFVMQGTTLGIVIAKLL